MARVGEGASRDTRRRLTINQAADHLGITVDAVRGRIKRDTIDHVRDGGRVYVLLAADEPRPGRDQGADQDALTSELRDRLRYVENQLEAERQAHAESRRLLLAALERIPPQLEAPSDAPEAPQMHTVGEGRGTDSTDSPGPESGAERVSWWRRMFGG